MSSISSFLAEFTSSPSTQLFRDERTITFSDETTCAHTYILPILNDLLKSTSKSFEWELRQIEQNPKNKLFYNFATGSLDISPEQEKLNIIAFFKLYNLTSAVVHQDHLDGFYEHF